MSQRYPTPDIRLSLARIEDSFRPIFSPAQLKKYQAAVDAVFLDSPPLDIAGKALQKIRDDYPESDNWHTSLFSNVFGAMRSPVASSNRLSLRLKPPTPPSPVDPQVYSTAMYLRAIGIWAVHLRDGDTFTPKQKDLKHQMDGFLYTFTDPGPEMDKLYTLAIPDDINAVVFYHGVPHLVRIAASQVVLSVEAISTQLDAVKAKEVPSGIFPIGAYSWRLGRTEWYHVFQQLLAVDENRSLFELLKTSAITVALDGESPTPATTFIDDVRGDTGSSNRYSDQTFVLVVYSDGEVGVCADHAPADFAALIELTTILGSTFREDRFPRCADAVSPQTLHFKFPKLPVPKLPPKYEEPLQRTITTFDLPPMLDRSARPSDALLNITFQIALLAARPGFMQPIYQPVHQRDFTRGRVDSMWPISQESTAFVRRLLSIGGVPTDASELEELRRLLEEANEKRRKLVTLSRGGKVPYMFLERPLKSATQSVLEDETAPQDFKQSVQTVLDAWSKTRRESVLPSSPTDDTILQATEKSGMIIFTGFTLPGHDPALGEYPLEGDILGGLAGLFMPGLLALLYLVRPDGSAFISLNASGHFKNDTGEIRRQMEAWYPKVVTLWRKG